MTDNTTGYYWENSLPKALEGDIENLKEGSIQLSRLFAWSWCSVLAHEGDARIAEQALKRVFIKLFKEQGRHTGAYQTYGIIDSKNAVRQYSEYLRNLFAGNHDAIKVVNDEDVVTIKANPEVTLKAVLAKLSGEDLMLARETELLAKFAFLVTFDSYTGGIVENHVPNEGEDGDFPLYSFILCFPPRPALGEYTVTDQQLCQWATKTDPKEKGYLPPAYIPIGACT